MSKLPIPLAILFAPLLLTSCETPQMVSSVTSATFCQLAKPIRASRMDTDGTLEQIEEFNAVGVKLCGWKK